jgi:hypothetical protein
MRWVRALCVIRFVLLGLPGAYMLARRRNEAPAGP